VLSEDDYLSVRSERTPFLLEVDVFAHFQQAGKFDDTELLRKIERREFVAVITKVPIDAAMRPRWAFSRRWLEPIRAGYELVRTYGAPEHTETRYLYRPRTVSLNGAAFEKAAPGETIQL